MGYLKCIKNKMSLAIVVKSFMKMRNIGKLSDHLKNMNSKNFTHSFIYSFIQQILIKYHLC